MSALLFAGGSVYTGAGTSAEALLASDGVIVAVGGLSELARSAGRAERVDLRGGLLLPGWGDAHVHFMWWAIQMHQLDLRDVPTLEEALAQIAERARPLPAGAWLLGDGSTRTGGVAGRRRPSSTR